MSETHLFIPSFRNRNAVFRLTCFFLLVAVFLALFEVGLTNEGTISQLPLQLYLHMFFLLHAGFLLVVTFELLRRYIDPLPRQQVWWAAGAITVFTLCVSTIWVNVVHELTDVQDWSNSRVSSQMLFHSLLGLVIVGIALHYFDLQKRLIKQHSVDLQSQVYNLESRMQPHFFFNALNSLLHLVESKDDKAAPLVEDMAAFFRVSLRPPHMVSVKQEIDICQRYLNVEQLRLEDQFHIIWDIPSVYDLQLPQLPSLSLQPIFEYILTEGTQRQPMNVHVSARVIQDENDRLEMFWQLPLVEDSVYVDGLQGVLDKIKPQLDAHLGDEVQLFLQAGKQNHTIGLIYPINSVI